MSMFHSRLFVFTLLVTCSIPAWSATVVIQNADGPGEGLNDPNPPANANQKGNNPGTTLGQMRMNVLQAAGDVWGSKLGGTVTIVINAEFNDLFCAEFNGTLGQAGTSETKSGTAGSNPALSYPIALANALAGVDLNGGAAEINATFNSKLDTNDAGCLGAAGFYYGLDGSVPDVLPGEASPTPLFSVVLHELAHGLGFSSTANAGGDGSWLNAGAKPDPFSANLKDEETGKTWGNMSNAERVASAVNDPDLVWVGASVTGERGDFLDFSPIVKVNTPGGIAGNYLAVLGDEPTIVLPAAGVTADVVDGDALLDPADNCLYPGIPSNIAGKIILFDYDETCPAFWRAFVVEDAKSAVGVIIRSTDPANLPDMSGTIGNQEVTIPYVGVMQSVGDDIRANIATANVTIKRSATIYNGDNNGMLRMFAPSTFSQGSSASHWTGAASPDLLMEASQGELGFGEVDLTIPAFVDMGWPLNGSQIVIYKDGFED